MDDKDSGSDAGPMLAYGDKALGLQKEIYDSQRADAQPWYQTGSSAVNQLGMLMGLKPGSSATSRQSLIDQYKPQFTTKSSSSSGGMFVGPDGKVYTGPDQQSALNEFRSKNPWGVGGNSAYLDGLSTDSFKALNQSSDTTDFTGLNSYIDNLLAQQGQSAESNPLFGTLAKNFGMDDYVEDPGYQFRLGEGNKALERKLNASGKTYSPEAAKALMGYGQGMASEEYGNAYNRFNNDQGNLFNRLATLSGFGQTATGQVANAGANYANSASDIYTGQGNAIVAANQAKQANNSSMFNTLLGAGLTGARMYYGGGI